MRGLCVLLVGICLISSACCAQDTPNPAHAIEWRFHAGDVSGAENPDFDDSGWETAAYKHKWKCRGFAWFRGTVTIPDSLDGKPTEGRPVALRWNAGDGGEVYLNGKLDCRYDNDHPPLILLAEAACPQQQAQVAICVFMGPDDNTDRETDMGECDLTFVDEQRIRRPFPIAVDAGKPTGRLVQPFAGVSQGGGMPDYNPDTAAKLRELGIKWFRMDNVLTWAVKQREDGSIYYDWEDFDRRVDFIKSIPAEPIMCLSYMPIPFDTVPNPDRHSRPKDWKAWEDLVYEAAKRCIERNVRVKYWEVWNESNAGWIVPMEGEDLLETYLKLYDACVRGVKRADPNAWIGGPCNAAGPWNREKGGAFVRGEMFMRGLMKHCEETGMPLDFVTWHEYFQPWQIIKDEAETTRRYLQDYPKVREQVKEFMLTEWNYAWWGDRAHDNEIGAAWCATSVLRAMIPGGIDKTCFFLAKDGDENFRGGWGMLMGGNKPKPSANVCRMFNMLAPERIHLEGEDGEITGIASRDAETGKVTVLLVNYAERYGARRDIALSVTNLPATLRGGTCRRYLVDKDHSNIWANRDRAELETAETVPIPKSGVFKTAFRLEANAVTLLEFAPNE